MSDKFASRAQSNSVAVLDDDDLVRHSLVNALAILGLTARGCANPADFYRAVETTRPGIVIIDQLLGDAVSGWQVLQHLRGKYPQQVAVIITGYPDAELSNQVAASNRTLLLTKPFRLQALEQTLGEASVLLAQESA